MYYYRRSRSREGSREPPEYQARSRGGEHSRQHRWVYVVVMNYGQANVIKHD